MKKIEGLTERGYKVTGVEHDRTLDGKYVYIQNDEDIYICLGSSVVEVEEDVQEITQSNKGYSAKVEFETNKEDKYTDSRNLDIIVTVKGNNQEQTKSIFYEIQSIMEDELQLYKIEFAGCPNNEEFNGKYEYSDIANIEYEHGSMKEIKDDIKEAFKTAKKQLGIR